MRSKLIRFTSAGMVLAGAFLAGCKTTSAKVLNPAAAASAPAAAHALDKLPGATDADKAAWDLLGTAEAKDKLITEIRWSRVPASPSGAPAAPGTPAAPAAPAPKKEVTVASDGSVEIAISKAPAGIVPTLLLDGNGVGSTTTHFTPIMGRDYQVNARWFQKHVEEWCVEGPTCKLNAEIRVGGQLLDGAFTRKNDPKPNVGGGDFWFRILEAGEKDVTRTDPDPKDATKTVTTTVRVKVYEIQPTPAPTVASTK